MMSTYPTPAIISDAEVQELVLRMADESPRTVTMALCDLLFRKFGTIPGKSLIRSITGRGSNTTIQDAINSWTAQLSQAYSSGKLDAPVSQELQEAWLAIWHMSIAEAGRRFNDDKSQYEKRIQELTDVQAGLRLELESARTEVSRLNQVNDSLEKREAALSNDLRSATNQVATLLSQLQIEQQANSTLKSEIRTLIESTAEQVKRAEGDRDAGILRAQKQYDGLRDHLMLTIDQERSFHKSQVASLEDTLSNERTRFGNVERDLQDRVLSLSLMVQLRDKSIEEKDSNISLLTMKINMLESDNKELTNLVDKNNVRDVALASAIKAFYEKYLSDSAGKDFELEKMRQDVLNIIKL